MVTAWVGLVVPSGRLAKLREVLLRVETAVRLVPVPLTVASCDGAMSNMAVRVPLKALAELGWKVMVKFAHFAGAMVTGIVPATWYCESEGVRPVTVIVVVPRLYTVTVCGPLIVPVF